MRRWNKPSKSILQVQVLFLPLYYVYLLELSKIEAFTPCDLRVLVRICSLFLLSYPNNNFEARLPHSLKQDKTKRLVKKTDISAFFL